MECIRSTTELFDGRIQSGLAAYRIIRLNALQVDDSRPAVNGIDQFYLGNARTWFVQMKKSF